jgi:hypothetical protein
VIQDDLVTYLAAQSLGTVGTTIFKVELPATPDTCLAVIPYGGLPPQHTFGTDHAIRKPRFQVVCRGARDDSQAPLAKAQLVYAALHLTNQTLSGTRYLRCEAIDEPRPLMQDDNGRWLVTCNYEAQFDGA